MTLTGTFDELMHADYDEAAVNGYVRLDVARRHHLTCTVIAGSHPNQAAGAGGRRRQSYHTDHRVKYDRQSEMAVQRSEEISLWKCDAGL